MRTVVLAVVAGAALAGAAASARADQHAQQISRGKVVFDHWCVVCHGSGPYMAGTQQLRVNYGSKEPALLSRRTDLTPAFVKAMVRLGYGIMPRFRKTEVSDADLAAVAAYLSRNNPAYKRAK